MAYWLMKSEPSSYGWNDLVRDGATEWDGVRNNAARLHLKAMKAGDEAFLYHSMTDKAVVGIIRVVREAQPDPKNADWVTVRVEPVRPLEQ
ncbi:MAG: EVE domain-containing protein, partial [Pseudomonadota bacterium]|nr:EVE domain-containing protein [Pseudomonadota bacterium]